MSFELPLFPLNVVLFPGMPLPLHIFEPRYRLMINRCVDAGRVFGVAMLIEGQEGQSGTVPAGVGCTARILEVAPFADGRMNLSTVGERRFRILSMREEDEYLIGTCEWLEDEPESERTSELATRLRRRLSSYFDAMSLNTQLPAQLADLEIPQGGELFSLFIGAILSLPNPQKQQLLEMTCTDDRLEVEEYLLERAEIVQRAYAYRAAQGYKEPPADTQLGQLSNFVSLN